MFVCDKNNVIHIRFVEKKVKLPIATVQTWSTLYLDRPDVRDAQFYDFG